MRVTYYPGCSLESTAKEYDDSIREVFRLLEIDLEELEDWSCCGATSAHSLDPRLAIGLAARNIALASNTDGIMLVPCAACFNRQKAAEVALSNNPLLKEEIEKTLEIPFKREVKIQNLLQFFGDKLDLIRSKTRGSFSAERVACYYGCLLTRPPKVIGESNFEDPQSMDEIVKALGMTPVAWSYKTECCGAAFSIYRKDIVLRLISKIFEAAIEAGAESIITACPLCQANLDTRQREAAGVAGKQWEIPIIFISELMAEAFGSDKTQKLYRKHFVSPASRRDNSDIESSGARR